MATNYAQNRKIKQDRIYKTLGKMSWWRIIAGVALLLLLLLISGVASKPFASRGNYKLAKTLMIAPGWMETYKPEEKAYIEAGVLFEEGRYEEALDAFYAISEHTETSVMASRTELILLSSSLLNGEYEKAYELASKIRTENLSETEQKEYAAALKELEAHFTESSDAAMLPNT